MNESSTLRCTDYNKIPLTYLRRRDFCIMICAVTI